MTPVVLPTTPELVDRLAAHRTIGSAPRAELEWLARHGELRRFEVGERAVVKGTPLDEMVVMLTGHIAMSYERSTGRRFALEGFAGDLTALLPYSRAGLAMGDIDVLEPTEALCLHRRFFPELLRECPTIVEFAVHVMLERSRLFNAATAQDDKMMAMGRIAAGLAHELNNPASAASRSAKQLGAALTAAERAAEAIGALQLSEARRSRLEDIAGGTLMPTSTGVFSAIERADHEEDIAEWLDANGADASLADTLAESGVSRHLLDAVADDFDGDDLNVVLRWLGAVNNVRTLAAEVERATTRIHNLVSSVKRFTYMDRGMAPEPTDITQGLNDTVAVLSTKAKAKSVAIRMDIAPQLPRVMANPGELNQVWSNLIENAIDALPEGGAGELRVVARAVGKEVAVCVIDNGPGVPADLQQRIFEPFFTTKPIGQGTGMGLDIALRVVRQFGGSILLDSKPGRTEFHVSLPVSRSAEPASTGAAS